MDGQGKGSLLMLLVVSSLLLWKNAASQSNSTNETSYSPVSTADLFDRAIVLSYHTYRLSSELYQEFTTLYSPQPDFFIMYMKKCHTASISTPHEKEQALRMPQKDFIILLIRLLHSWDDPLSHLIARAFRLPGVTLAFTEKAEKLQERMQQLLQGLKIISSKVEPEIKDYGDYAVWTELPALLSADGEDVLLTLHHLCRCLRRDMHMVDSFLKLMRKRVA